MKKKMNFLIQVIDEFSKKNKKNHKKKVNFSDFKLKFSNDEDDGDNESDIDDENNVFLKKYKKTNFSYFFILSNKNIQASFYDKTKVIFTCYEPKKITFFNKNDEEESYPIKNNNFCDYKCDNHEIRKKINYAIKEINK